ncbi:Uncharacterised protein [Mycobacteroides abscessus subsp. massiliense]|jgi:hypothetical protein|nr:Uncharacterised protein [Mycobacteroides abscessus subsp. massiliense]SKR65311.1 Uncharacterised protein [Mycobacteroides abscessus subsp. abscessus]SLH53264.1 Uncharacterised protein [Mycobacteroides abscessus subsp. massiliense]
MTDTPPTPRRLDGRVTVSEGELANLVRLLRETVDDSWLAVNFKPDYGAGQTKKIDTKAAQALAIALLQRINSTRLGYAEGTVATHGDGRLARRYYSDAEQRLTWLVVQPPSDKQVEVESGPELPGLGWHVRDDKPWQVVQ